MDQVSMRNVLVGIAAALAVSACAGGNRREAAAAQQEAIERAEATIREAQAGGAFEQGGA